MGKQTFFISGDKSFELISIGDSQIKWYSLIERSRRFTSRINVDEKNLRWFCNALKQASKGVGDLYRRWGRSQQQLLYRVYQNYNIYGRLLRLEVWQGQRKSAVIIPELEYNSGWVDIADKILRFLGNPTFNGPFPPASPLKKTFFDAAKIEEWPEKTSKLGEAEHPLSRCLIGVFNDPFNISPNTETIQKWFLSRWKISAGLKVTPVDHNCFLFEFPSRHEAMRIITGDWFWKGRHLALQWWTTDFGTTPESNRPENIWVKAFGVPLNAWTSTTFKSIGEQCGGYIGEDEDT